MADEAPAKKAPAKKSVAQKIADQEVNMSADERRVKTMDPDKVVGFGGITITDKDECILPNGLKYEAGKEKRRNF